jgi:hypothetical protein
VFVRVFPSASRAVSVFDAVCRTVAALPLTATLVFALFRDSVDEPSWFVSERDDVVPVFTVPPPSA